MPILNFKARFVDPVLAGTKPHTIRAFGKRPHRPGETLFMQTGPRFQPRRFAVHQCRRVREVLLYPHLIMIWHEDNSGFIVPARDRFARCDGFEDWEELQRFFAPLLDARECFHGQLIQWAPADWENDR